jgi:hypothetical protein
MGKIVSHTTYEYYEYITAILISIGMTLFMLDSSEHKNGNIYIYSIIDITSNISFSTNMINIMTKDLNTFRWRYNNFWCYLVGRLLIIR